MENLELITSGEFVIRQKIRMIANEYTIESMDGRVLGYAKQKVMALRERVTFFTDQSMSQPLFSFQARNVLDVSSVCDVFDGSGQQIGYFQKDFGASFLRSTWDVHCAAGRFRGQERNVVAAILRRFTDLPMFYNFDFDREDGTQGFTIDRQMTFRDAYHVVKQDSALDGRVVAALAVAMDVLQNR